MSVSAPTAVRHVVEEYKRYLRTSFRFLDPHLRAQFEEHLQRMDVLVRGPYVTLAREFERGRRLRELVDEGVLDPGVLRAAWPFGDEPLFQHQERSALAGAAGRPFLVTTGTGSGKTECFLIPVLDHCLKAHERGEPGVYHATCEGSCTWHAFGVAVLEECGIAPRVAPEPSRSRDFQTPVRRPGFSVLENARLKRMGIAAMPHWRDALRRYLRLAGHLPKTS